MPHIKSVLIPGGKLKVDIAGVHEVTIEELINSGGFGMVFRVFDTATRKPYALKVIIIDSEMSDSDRAEMIERIRREAIIRIPNANIVKVHGLKEWDTATFLILMELVQGMPLRDVIGSTERSSGAPYLNANRGKELARQILTGVADVHRMNIIHRDLKPDNILIALDGPEPVVKMIDFGLAGFAVAPPGGKRITMAGQAFGTLPYMAPEILIEGVHIADARADIYALGHILYEMAMGKHWWVHANIRDIAAFGAYLQTGVTVAVDLSDYVPLFAPNEAEVLSRMLAVYPEQRYSRLDDVITALNLGGPRVVPRPGDMELRSPVLTVESGTMVGGMAVLNLADGESRVMGRYQFAGNEMSVSSKHVEFRREGDIYFVRDFPSKNGTLHNGVILGNSFTPLEHGDRLKLGDMFLRFAFLRK